MTNSMTVRQSQRVLVRCAVRYFSEGILGEGTVWDLSHSGWRVSGNHPVKEGDYLTLYIAIPAGKVKQWISADKAVVRWVKGLYFGIEILSMDQSGRQQLADFLDSYLEK